MKKIIAILVLMPLMVLADTGLSVYDDGPQRFKLGEDVSSCRPFGVNAELPVTVRVTGLPTGMSCRWDGEYVWLAGKASRAGVYLVTCTATDTKGRSLSDKVFIVIGVATCEVSFEAGGGTCSESWRLVESGKAIGTLPTPVRTQYKFLGWYTMSDGGTKVSSTTKVTTDMTCYAHWQFDGSAPVVIGVAEECEGLGAVSGGNKTFKAGTKVSLKATAKKGAAFAYWHDGENGIVSMSPSYSFIASGFEAKLTAYFIKAEEDWLCVYDDGNLQSDVGEILSEERCLFTIDSGSAATITVKGLPTGVKATTHAEQGEYWVTCSGKPTKVGIYWVTCTAKNGNGYQSSATFRWTVGNVDDSESWAYNDLDERGNSLGAWMLAWDGLSDYQILETTLETGRYFDTDIALGPYVQVGAKKLTMSGLPTGLKYEYKQGSCCGDFLRVYGRPTKAGHYDVKITATYPNGTTRKVSKSIYVKDSGSRYLAVRCGNGYEDRGTVTGSGVYACGSNVKLSAKAKKGYYFAGWYADPECRSGCCGNDEGLVFMVSGDYQKASDTYSFVKSTSAEDHYTDEDEFIRCIYAKFVTREEDGIGIDFWVHDEEYDYDCEGRDRMEYDYDLREATWFVRATPASWEANWGECFFRVESGTLPTVSVSGLPSGCKWDKKTNRLYFPKQPSKPGISKATIKVKNLSGVTKEWTLYVKVPNLRSDVFDGLDYEEDYRVTQGVSDACVPSWCEFSSEEGWKVSASGLPSGLKFAFEQGWGEAHGRIFGTPTKAGTYTVTLTAKRGKETQKATVTFVVDPLPDYVIGKFNGVLRNGDECIGAFALTATAAGKLSVSMVLKDGTKKSYSASSWNCVNEGDVYVGCFTKAAAKGSCVASEESVYLEVRPDSRWDGNQLHGNFIFDPCKRYGEGEIVAQRNPFGKVGKEYENWEAHSIAATLAGYGKMGAVVVDSGDGNYVLACPNCAIDPSALKPELTFTASTDGMVKMAGKLAGKSVSGSTVLRIIDGQPQVDFILKVNETPTRIHIDFYLGYGANGAVDGYATIAW